MAVTVPYIIGGLVGTGLGVGGAMLMSKSNTASKMPQMPVLPSAPKPEQSINKAEELIKRKKAGLAKTIFTNPLGIVESEHANILKKTLGS